MLNYLQKSHELSKAFNRLVLRSKGRIFFMVIVLTSLKGEPCCLCMVFGDLQKLVKTWNLKQLNTSRTKVYSRHLYYCRRVQDTSKDFNVDVMRSHKSMRTLHKLITNQSFVKGGTRLVLHLGLTICIYIIGQINSLLKVANEMIWSLPNIKCQYILNLISMIILVQF